MADARQWVRKVIASSQLGSMTNEEILRSFEEHIGKGKKATERVQAVLGYIDGELIGRRGGLMMRDLWTTVADNLEKT